MSLSIAKNALGFLIPKGVDTDLSPVESKAEALV
jgi:hypothetical protein